MWNTCSVRVHFDLAHLMVMEPPDIATIFDNTEALSPNCYIHEEEKGRHRRRNHFSPLHIIASSASSSTPLVVIKANGWLARSIFPSSLCWAELFFHHPYPPEWLFAVLSDLIQLKIMPRLSTLLLLLSLIHSRSLLILMTLKWQPYAIHVL